MDNETIDARFQEEIEKKLLMEAEETINARFTQVDEIMQLTERI